MSIHPIYGEPIPVSSIHLALVRPIVALIGAEHMLFTGQCEQIRWYLKFFSGEFCEDSNWEREYAHQITKHFSTAFLLAELQGDSTALVFLAPQDMEFEGVRYESYGY